MTRTLPNLRFKKNQPFRLRPQNNSFNKKGKGRKQTKVVTRSVPLIYRSTVRSYKCNDLGHFVNECKKPNKKDKAYLEL